MAFQTRCPECNAKLKFDEAPEAEEAIECPRCGHVFDAADAKPIKVKKKALAGGGGEDEEPRVKKKKKKAKAPDGTPKKRRSKKKKANLFVLWVMLGVTLFLAPFVGWFGWKLFFSEGKVGSLLAYMPKECNWMRGCDLQRLLSQPVFKEPCDVVLKGPFDECRSEFGKAAGYTDVDKFFDYAMCGKSINGGTSTIYIFETLKPFDSANMLKNLGGSQQTVDGQQVQKLSRSGVLAGAYVYCPAERVIVVVASEGDPMRMLKGSLAAKANPKEASIKAVFGSCGKKATRGHIWNLMRTEGDLKNRLNEDIAEPVKQGLSQVSQRVAATKVFATWINFGKSIGYGIGLECDGAETASSFAKSLEESDSLGKGDDSQIPRDLTGIFPYAKNKDFVSGFMSELKFKSMGTCAYLESKMNYEKSAQMLSFFNRPNMYLNFKE